MDEVSQVVEMEYKGVYYLIKGNTEFIAFATKMIKALMNWVHDRNIKRPGESSWAKLQEASEGNAVILEFPEEMFRKDEKGVSPFDRYVKENKLRYCVMPDFNPDDSFVPVGVVSQDVALHQRHINEFVDLRVREQKEKDVSYDEKIAELKEKLVNARSSKDRESIAKELSSMVQAKQENMDVLEEIEGKREKGYVLSFEEYLKQGEKTTAKDNPEKAIVMSEKCGGIVEYEPMECMYPIRDKDKVPVSKEVYYSQKAKDNNFYTIKREFVEDEHGLIFSKYFVKNAKNGSDVTTFSDQGFTRDEWKDKLSEILEGTGMEMKAKTAAFHTEDRLKEYMELVKKNFTDAPSHEAVSEEAKELIETVKEETSKKESYEKLKTSNYVVSSERIMPSDKGVIAIEVDEGLVEGIGLDEVNSREAHISVKSDEIYVLERPDNTRSSIKGIDLIEKLEKEKSKSQTKVAEITKGKGRG